MSMIVTVRNKMNEALKSGNKAEKEVFASILSALTLREKTLRETLSPEQELEVLSKIQKQSRESIDTCPIDRTELLKQYNFELALISSFLPEQMNEEQIVATIKSVFSELGMETPTKSDKGKVMKVLMPLTKGKADGKLVNVTLDGLLA